MFQELLELIQMQGSYKHTWLSLVSFYHRLVKNIHLHVLISALSVILLMQV